MSAPLRSGTLLLLLFLSLGCGPIKEKGPTDERILKLRKTVLEGRYTDGLDMALGILEKSPSGAIGEEALYYQAYLLAFGRSDFQGARAPLGRLLEAFPKGTHALEAQRLLADCFYWQGHYDSALKEYGKLLLPGIPSETSAYALFQKGNCLLLDDKVSEAQETYRSVVERYKTEPISDSAQLMLANSYLKLQAYKAAKSEFKKLMAFTRDKGLQKNVQKALRQIEQEEPFQGRVGVE